jgi:nucleoside-diphosphate-sugar epimerase
LIIASRNPRQTGKLKDFLSVNNLIINALKLINYSEDSAPKFTLLSSFSVYEKNLSHIDDGTAVMPNDYYGESKLLLEESLYDLSKVVAGDLLVCRLPTFLYNGVSERNDNFLAKLSLAIAANSSFTLTNPDACLSAVFDVESLVKLDQAFVSGFKIINCGCIPDITFFEIGQLALALGLKNVDWKKVDRPSVEVCLKSLNRLLGFKPSAKELIKSWMVHEVKLQQKLSIHH